MMKPTATLKEILKPPFVLSDNSIYDSSKDWAIQPVIISDFSDHLRGDIRRFIAAALNEKWERDFGERERWITCYTGVDGDVEYLKCPECNWDDLDTDHEAIFNFCPHCGERLDPPGEEKDG